MNTADRSIAILDTALRRRFKFEELMPIITDVIENISLGNVELHQYFETINERIECEFDREHQIGHAFFIGCNSKEKFEEIMRLHVIPLLSEFFFDHREKIAKIVELIPIDENITEFNGCFFEAKEISSTNTKDNEFSDTILRWNVKEKFELDKLSYD